MIETLKNAKPGSSAIDAFTKPFLPAFELFCVLPFRKRQLEEQLQKIEKASEVVAEEDAEAKKQKEIEKNRLKFKKLGKRPKEIEHSDVARGRKKLKTSASKAMSSLMHWQF